MNIFQQKFHHCTDYSFTYSYLVLIQINGNPENSEISPIPSHGYHSGVIGQKSFASRALWRFCILILFIICSYFATQHIQVWLENKVVTFTSPVDTDKLTFPSVTLCLSKFSQNDGMVSQQLDSSVFLACYFDNMSTLIKCNLEDFVPLKLPAVSFVNCYRYNFGLDKDGKGKQLLELNNTGIFTGLVLQLNIPKNSIASVVLTGNFDRPSYKDMFYYITPRRKTIMRIEEVREHKLPEPYNPCYADLTSHESHFVQEILRRNITYRRVTCYDLCYESHTERLSSASMKFKSAFKKFKASYEFIVNACKDLCPLECDSVRFEVFQQQMVIPENFYLYYKKLHNLSDATSCDQLASLHINYNELKFTQVTQTPKVGFFGLVSNIGGLFSLFLEFSLLSVTRILQSVLTKTRK